MCYVTHVLHHNLNGPIKTIAGWCFWNEAHVAVIDAEYRDFSSIHEITKFCPRYVHCMHDSCAMTLFELLHTLSNDCIGSAA